MIIFTHTPSLMVVADEGKLLRAKNDVYVAEHIDENGNKVDEYFPYRTSVIFLPKTISEKKVKEMYIEEDE